MDFARSKDVETAKRAQHERASHEYESLAVGPLPDLYRNAGVRDRCSGAQAIRGVLAHHLSRQRSDPPHVATRDQAQSRGGLTRKRLRRADFTLTKKPAA